MSIRCLGRMLSRFSVLVVLALGAACGGSGSGDGEPTSPPASDALLRGVVEDGPIAGAVVHLLRKADGQIIGVCGANGREKCETRSDRQGRFSFRIGSEVVAADHLAVSIGGQDRDTGVDFTDLEMRAPLELFFADELVVISPVTTLLAGLLDSGLAGPLAQAQVRAGLALPATVNLIAPPSTDPELLRRSLLLTKIVIELKGEGHAAPFALLAEHSAGVEPLLTTDGQVQSAVLTALGLGPAAQQRIVALVQRIAGGGGEPLSGVFMQEELVQALTIVLERMLGAAVPQDSHYVDNVRTLADRMLAAAGAEGIPFGGIVPQRLARYVLFSYGLQNAEKFSLPAAEFAVLLAGLASDPLIAELAQSKALHSAAAPQLADELPGDNNEKRIAYYYGSDRSHLYQAEKLVGLVFDDVINDALMVKIVQGKATAGLLAEARNIIATQIFQSEAKANAHRAYGKVLLSFARPEEAKVALHRAKELYIAVIEAKGKASADNTDIFNLQATAASLRKAGDLDGVRQILAYQAEVAEILADDVIAMGRLFVGVRNVADDYIAVGDLTAAAPVIATLHELAMQVPASLSGGVPTYRLRVYYLIETAKRYADLEQNGAVQEIHDYIEALRSADGYQNLTGAESWVWTPALVETLYRSGHRPEALALAHSIPDAYVDAAGKSKSGLIYQRAAFKQVATHEALSGSLETAFAMVDNHFSEDEDKIEVLTYFASNKGVEYIGLALIEAGRYDEARVALPKATLFLAGLSKTTDQARYTDLLQRGYVKIADLYGMMGDFGAANELLQQAATVIDQLTGVKFIIDGLVDIALAHQQLGQWEEARALLELARSKAELAAPLLQPEDAALLYEALAKAWLTIGDPSEAQWAVFDSLHWARLIHSSDSIYAGNGHDDAAGKEVDFLLRAGLHLLSAGQGEAALAVLAEAEQTTTLIYNEATRLGKYIYPKPVANPTKNHIIGGYAKAKAYSRALALAIDLPYAGSRNDAVHFLANAYGERDDFPDSWVASIDTDGDGRPDFFNPLASTDDIAASGLLLDDDSDGDGIADRFDSRPLYRD